MARIDWETEPIRTIMLFISIMLLAVGEVSSIMVFGTPADQLVALSRHAVHVVHHAHHRLIGFCLLKPSAKPTARPRMDTRKKSMDRFFLRSPRKKPPGRVFGAAPNCHLRVAIGLRTAKIMPDSRGPRLAYPSRNPVQMSASLAHGAAATRQQSCRAGFRPAAHRFGRQN